MRRREFISVLGGAVAVWPLATRAQQPERVRRIGVLMHTAAEDADGQTRLAAFLQGLQETGWAVGRNVHIDTRWASANADRFRSHAVDLLALAPDVVFASTSRSFPKRHLDRANRVCGGDGSGCPGFRRQYCSAGR
jgi:DNA-binding LacI/PurR family transcriptional regulator